MENGPRGRPARDEYAEYYDRYVSRVPDGDVLGTLERQVAETVSRLRAVPVDVEDFRYAEGKWTTKEVVRHVIDVEWVFTYRALTIARGDRSPLPGMDQDDFAANGDVAGITLADLADELEHLRAAGVRLLGGLADDAWGRRGVASGRPFSVRALAWVIAGHEAHHLGVLRDRYLGDTP
jgi:hypothetical protein